MATNGKAWKQSSANGKLSLYLGKREFVDYPSGTEAIDGVLLVDQDCISRGCKVWGQLVCNFRYGREEDEIMGINLQRYIFLVSEQIHPSQNHSHADRTFLQKRLLNALGSKAVPFTFTFPPSAPLSVSLHQRKLKVGEPCGVSYYIKIFCGDNDTDCAHQSSIIRFGVKKIQYAPADSCQPCKIVRKNFLLSPGELELQVILDKQIYNHGERIAINICVKNRSRNKLVRKIEALVQQEIDVVIYEKGKFKVVIDTVETHRGCPISPASTLQMILYLTLDMKNNTKRIALDERFKPEQYQLASSTLLTDPADRNSFAFIISYGVKVKLHVGGLGGELCAMLPIKVMRPKPADDIDIVPT